MSIKKKRQGLLTQGVVLLHDNAPPPYCSPSECFARAVKVGNFYGVLYNSDLAPSDDYLFTKMKA